MNTCIQFQNEMNKLRANEINKLRASEMYKLCAKSKQIQNLGCVFRKFKCMSRVFRIQVFELCVQISKYGLCVQKVQMYEPYLQNSSI